MSIQEFTLEPWLKNLGFEAEIVTDPKLVAVLFEMLHHAYISSRYLIILIHKLFNKEIENIVNLVNIIGTEARKKSFPIRT